MTIVLSCSECGQPVPTDAGTLGLCPRCLMSRALGGGGDDTNESPDAPAPDAADLAGEFPDLEILSLLGRGGMGTVYAARQRNLDRVVAVKLFARDRYRDPSFEERFRHEARTLASLGHPNVVTAHDFGATPRFFYLVMEHVPGPSLRDVLRSGSLPQQLAVTIAAQVCDALRHAHAQGIVHRDIKPENVLLHPGGPAMPELSSFFPAGGRVRVADFGLSRLTQRRTSDYSLTSPDHRLGTPFYMAPEQRDRPRDVDARADLYALGVVLYEMLTGELPVGRFPDPSVVAGSDPRLDPVVLRCLEKDPSLRYPSAADLRRALASFAHAPPDARGAHGGALAPPLPYATPAPPPARSTRVVALVAALAVAGIALIGVMLFVRQIRTVKPAVRATPVPAPPVVVQVPFPVPPRPPLTGAPYDPGFGPGRFGSRDFLADLRAQHGDDRVAAIYVDELPGDVGSFVTDRLKSLTGASSTVTSGGGGPSVTVHLAPVGDVQRLADKIDFGKVTKVDPAKRTITVVADPAKLPAPMKPAVTDVNDPAFYAQNLADLSSYDPGRRREALDRLKSSPSPTTPHHGPIRTALLKLLADGDVQARRTAVEALAAWAGRDATPDLLPLLSDADRSIRLAAIRALKVAADPAAAAALADALPAERRDAAEALLAIGPPAEDAVLAKLAVTTDTFAKAQLADILGQIGTAKSLPALKRLAAENRGMAQNAAKKAVEAIEGR